MSLVDRFLLFEKEKCLFDKKIKRIFYWNHIRYFMFSELSNEKEKLGAAHTTFKDEKFFKRIIMILKQLKYLIFKNSIWFLKKKDILILNHQRRVKDNNYYDCVYTDEMLKKINYSYYVFEQPIMETHYKPIRTKNVRYLDLTRLKNYISIIVNKRILGFKLEESEIISIKNIVNEFNLEFSATIDLNKVISKVENEILLYNSYYKYYRRVLKMVSPKMIIEVVSYGNDKYALNTLAKERGIPVIELQHGTMGKYHIAYNFAEIMDLPTFPDYIFTFGGFWQENTRLPIDKDRAKVVGWPYFEKKVNEFKGNKLKKDTSQKTILFISQGTIGKDLSKIAIEVSKKFDEKKYKIIYKLHPGEYSRWMSEYPWLLDAELEVIDNNHQDMHYYFTKSDIQIGVYSTALFEGLGYELETIIIKLYGYEAMADLYELGLADLARNADEIVNLVKGNENKESKYNLSYFWEQNSLTKMLSEIDKIMKMRDEP